MPLDTPDAHGPSSSPPSSVDGPSSTANDDVRMRMLVESVTDYALYMLDTQGRVKSWNTGAERIKGYRREEILGRHFRCFYTAEAAAAGLPEHEMTSALAVGRYEDEGWRVRKDGTRFWANVVLTPVRDEEGTLQGYAKVTRDVSERKLVEDRLTKSEERFRLLVESVTDYAIYMVDVSGTVVSWNTGAGRIKGYHRDEIIGRHFRCFYLPEAAARGEPETELRVALATGRYEEEGWRVRRDGTRFWANVVLTPVRDADGELEGFAKVTRDITDRKRAEESLRTDHDELERRVASRTAELHHANSELRREAEERRTVQAQLLVADRMASVGTLAAGVAHEINNPLSFVLLNIETITNELTDLIGGATTGRLFALLECAKGAARGAERVRRIVRDLRVFARSNDEQRKAIALAPVLDLAVNMTHNEIRHRARLVKDYRTKAAVLADDSRLTQVIINLLLNAAQSIPEGRASHNLITIRTLDDGVGRVFVEVADTGTGIPDDLIGRIFDPFFTTKPVGVGTGLGLSICHGIVSGLGGEITVTNGPERGCTFRVALPMAREEDQARDDGPRARASVPVLPLRPRVLIIDDDEMAASALRMQLAQVSDVTVIHRGAEAIERLAAGERFTLILCDLMMPEMAGPAVYAEVARRTPDLLDRLVFVTGGAFTLGAQAFLASTPVRCLEKPVDTDELRALLAAYVVRTKGNALPEGGQFGAMSRSPSM